MSDTNRRELGRQEVPSQEGLSLRTLFAREESITIGPVHQRVLQDRRRKLERKLSQTKFNLDGLVKILIKEKEKEKSSVQAKFRSPVGHTSKAEVDKVETVTEEVKEEDEGQIKIKCQLQLNELQDKYQKELDDLYKRLQKDWRKDPRQKEWMEPGLNGDADSQYLARALGHALQRGLAEICEVRPWDPIEYLALWLRKYASNIQDQQEEAVLALKLKLEKEEAHNEEEKQEEMRQETAHTHREEERRAELYLQREQMLERQNERKDEKGNVQKEQKLKSDTEEEKSREDDASISEMDENNKDIRNPGLSENEASYDGAHKDHGDMQGVKNNQDVNTTVVTEVASRVSHDREVQGDKTHTIDTREAQSGVSDNNYIKEAQGGASYNSDNKDAQSGVNENTYIKEAQGGTSYKSDKKEAQSGVSDNIQIKEAQNGVTDNSHIKEALGGVSDNIQTKEAQNRVTDNTYIKEDLKRVSSKSDMKEAKDGKMSNISDYQGDQSAKAGNIDIKEARGGISEMSNTSLSGADDSREAMDDERLSTIEERE